MSRIDGAADAGPVASAAMSADIAMRDKCRMQSTTRHRADHEKRLGAVCDNGGKRRVGRIVRQVSLAGEESHVCAALVRHVIAHRSAQRGVTGFECVEHSLLREVAVDVEADLAIDASQRAKVRRQDDTDHGSV
jgi:hypothetical protein